MMKQLKTYESFEFLKSKKRKERERITKEVEDKKPKEGDIYWSKGKKMWFIYSHYDINNKEYMFYCIKDKDDGKLYFSYFSRLKLDKIQRDNFITLYTRDAKDFYLHHIDIYKDIKKRSEMHTDTKTSKNLSKLIEPFIDDEDINDILDMEDLGLL